MREFHPEYILDSQQHTKAVLLPIEEWEEILMVMEELEDIKAYDEASAIEEEVIPFEQAVAEINKMVGE